jgi:hypothetical protein
MNAAYRDKPGFHVRLSFRICRTNSKIKTPMNDASIVLLSGETLNTQFTISRTKYKRAPPSEIYLLFIIGIERR